MMNKEVFRKYKIYYPAIEKCGKSLCKICTYRRPGARLTTKEHYIEMFIMANGQIDEFNYPKFTGIYNNGWWEVPCNTSL